MRRNLILAKLAILALTLSACSGTASTPTTTSTTTSTTTTTTTVPPTTTTTTVPPTTTTTTEAPKPTFSVEVLDEEGNVVGRKDAEPGFYTRALLASSNVENGVLFLEAVSEPYLVADVWGLEEIWVTDFYAGDDSDGNPIVISLAWGQEDWDISKYPFQGLMPSPEGDVLLGSTIIVLDANEAMAMIVPGWMYPFSLGTDAEWLQSCDGLYWCEAFRAMWANNEIIVSALESGESPPDGLIGSIRGFAYPVHYDRSP